jgi:hypothetical protein
MAITVYTVLSNFDDVTICKNLLKLRGYLLQIISSRKQLILCIQSRILYRNISFRG